MSIIRNLTANDIPLDDLNGITIEANSDYDLIVHPANDIATSLDLAAAFQSGNLVFLDPAGNPLTPQESEELQKNISAVQPAIRVKKNNTDVATTPFNVINFKGTSANITPSATGTVDVDILPGVGFTTIDGQEILTMIDSSRSNKILSVEKVNYLFSKTTVSNGSYLYFGDITSSSAGYVIPMNATLVGISYHKRTGDNINMRYDLYVDGSSHFQGIIYGTGSSEEKISDNALDVDLIKNQKIAIRATQTSGGGGHNNSHYDVSITLYFRWRG